MASVTKMVSALKVESCFLSRARRAPISPFCMSSRMRGLKDMAVAAFRSSLLCASMRLSTTPWNIFMLALASASKPSRTK